MNNSTRAIEVVMGDNSRIWVEATELEGTTLNPRREGDALGNRMPSFAQIKPVINSVATEIVEIMKTALPKKISVEFGIDFGIETGQLTALIVKGNTKANLKITLEWEAPS